MRAPYSSWGGPLTHFLARRSVYSSDRYPIPFLSKGAEKTQEKKSLRIKEEFPQPRGRKNSSCEQVQWVVCLKTSTTSMLHSVCVLVPPLVFVHSQVPFECWSLTPLG